MLTDWLPEPAGSRRAKKQRRWKMALELGRRANVENPESNVQRRTGRVGVWFFIPFPFFRFDVYVFTM
jgi:hypothetical protein